MITYPNLYHLKYFADAVELGSISAAAQKNLVTHPAISRAISSLEDHLGTALLEHQKKSFKLTEAGYRVAEQARILLTAASDFKSLSLEQSEATEIKIGLSRTLSEPYLGPLLQSLKTAFPKAIAKVRFGTTSEIIEAVANHSIDLGLTIGSTSLATLSQTVIQTGQFVLVEAGSKKEWDKDLESKSFLLTEPRTETEKLKAAYQKKFGSALPVQVEIGSWDVIGQLTQKGLGIGLLPDISIRNWKDGSYRKLRTPWFECSYDIYVHSLKNHAPNRVIPYAKDFLIQS